MPLAWGMGPCCSDGTQVQGKGDWGKAQGFTSGIRTPRASSVTGHQRPQPSNSL